MRRRIVVGCVCPVCRCIRFILDSTSVVSRPPVIKGVCIYKMWTLRVRLSAIKGWVQSVLVLSVPYPVHSSESGLSGILYFYLSCLCWIRFCECFVSKSYILYYYLRVIISNNLSLELSPILDETGFSLYITLLLIHFLISTRLSWGYGNCLIDLILHYFILKIGVLGLFLLI